MRLGAAWRGKAVGVCWGDLGFVLEMWGVAGKSKGAILWSINGNQGAGWVAFPHKWRVRSVNSLIQ